MECCHLRKVEPLKRALQGKNAWITGVRRSQTAIREKSSCTEWDKNNKLQKYNSLLNWDTDDIWDYINMFNVPYNVLHNEGYASIGCQPCTRSVSPEEDERAGRWWWESKEHKECGLHLK